MMKKSLIAVMASLAMMLAMPQAQANVVEHDTLNCRNTMLSPNGNRGFSACVATEINTDNDFSWGRGYAFNSTGKTDPYQVWFTLKYWSSDTQNDQSPTLNAADGPYIPEKTRNPTKKASGNWMNRVE